MTDFVITEHDIELLNDPVMDKQKIWARVRSHPLSEELKKERERVLCELLAYIHPDSRAGCVIKDKIEFLRVGES